MGTGGDWFHWVLYNIPPETRALPDGITPDEDGILQNGTTGFRCTRSELTALKLTPSSQSTEEYVDTPVPATVKPQLTITP